MQGNLLVANVIGFRGILQYRLEDRGASVIGKEGEVFWTAASDLS